MSEPTAEREAMNLNGTPKPAKPGPPPPPWKDDSDVLYVGQFHIDCMHDEFWILNQLNSGEFAKYRGKYVVVANKQLLAVSDDWPVTLRSEVVARTGITPNRLVIMRLETLDELPPIGGI